MKYPYLTVALLVFFGIIDIAILGNHYELTKSDWSGWVQAIGSIAALGVAIFVMSRQNANAMKVVLSADHRMLIRRAEAVEALINHAENTVSLFVFHVSTLANKPADEYFAGVLGGKHIMAEARAALATTPTYELGSVKMVSGVLLMLETLTYFGVTIQEWERNGPGALTNTKCVEATAHFALRARTSKATFQEGISELRESAF